MNNYDINGDDAMKPRAQNVQISYPLGKELMCECRARIEVYTLEQEADFNKIHQFCYLYVSRP